MQLECKGLSPRKGTMSFHDFNSSFYHVTCDKTNELSNGRDFVIF